MLYIDAVKEPNESEEDTSAEEWDDESDSDEETEYRPKKRIKHH